MSAAPGSGSPRSGNGGVEQAEASPTVAPVPHCRSCRCFKPKPKRRSGIKRDGADVAWSKRVRSRAEYFCQFVDPTRNWERCLNFLPPPSQGLHAAHCFGRAIKATRTDPDNGLAMCFPHHRAIDSDKALKHAIFRWWLGSERFDALEAKARAKRNRTSLDSEGEK